LIARVSSILSSMEFSSDYVTRGLRPVKGNGARALLYRPPLR
jgi:hypothetical protein